MTPYEQKQIDQIEEDRKRREREMLILMLLLFGTAARHATAAIRLGHDPAQAASDVILGNQDIHQPGLAAGSAIILANSHRDGLNRAILIGRENGVKIADPIEGSTILGTSTTYRMAAQRNADAMSRTLAIRIGTAMDDARQQGLNTRKTAIAVRDAIKTGGYLQDNPYLLRTVTEAQVLAAHGGGMWNGLMLPEMDMKLKGFQHHSVVDDVTTNICLPPRDGFARPKDDPFFLTNWAPLHFGCRSMALGVWHDREWSTDYPIHQPMPGFGRAPWAFMMGGLAMSA